MNCLTDSICSPDAFLTWLESTLSAIDYFGALAFGSEWRAIGPEVTYYVDVISGHLGDWFERPASGCQRYASLGDFNA